MGAHDRWLTHRADLQGYVFIIRQLKHAVKQDPLYIVGCAPQVAKAPTHLRFPQMQMDDEIVLLYQIDYSKIVATRQLIFENFDKWFTPETRLNEEMAVYNGRGKDMVFRVAKLLNVEIEYYCFNNDFVENYSSKVAYIYLVRTAGGHFKIGESMQAPNLEVRRVNSYSAREILVVTQVDGDQRYAIENAVVKSFLQQYQRFKKRREYFTTGDRDNMIMKIFVQVVEYAKRDKEAKVFKMYYDQMRARYPKRG